MFFPYSYGGSNPSYIILLVLVMIISLYAGNRVNRTFVKFSKIKAGSGLPANVVACNMLRDNNCPTGITRVSGRLTDHFNPKTNTVGLSDAVYNDNSVSALAVAAHEIGHVLQYEEQYAPIVIRNAILPVANIGSMAAPYIVLLGLFMGLFNLAFIGLVLFGATLLFQIVTLPVEFNASSRGINLLLEGGYISQDQEPIARKMLRAAALTYVLAAIASLINFLRFFSMVSSTRRK